jgi:hypothetical protein
MVKPMIGIRVELTRYISDEPQPGIVQCEFSDAHARRWSFVDKTAIFSAEHLDFLTAYPQPGVIACEIIRRTQDERGRDLMLVDTERPWGVESIEGIMRFEVLASSLVEWEWGSTVQRAWDGRIESD